MQTTLISPFALRGDMTVRVRDVRTGETVRRYQIRNKIMDTGFAAVIRLLNNADVTGVIAHLRPGTGVRALAAGETALGASTPAGGDVNLAGPIILTPGSVGVPPIYVDLDVQKTVLQPSGGPFELRVLATLDGGLVGDVFNGKTINEAGLVLADGTLFSRQLHPSIEKTVAIAIDYEWRISLLPAA